MDKERMNRAFIWIRRNIRLSEFKVYNPLDFVADNLLPKYAEVPYKLKNDDMIIRRLETLANICNIISEYKYGFSEEFLILLIGFSEVKALMDLEYPKPKSISSYIYDNFSRELSHMTSDFDKIETVIEDVKRPDILVTRYHQGGLDAKILHDVNYLSLMDADFLIKSFYADYCYDNEEDESSKQKAWLRLFTRFSKVGDRNIIIPEIKLSPYYKERIKLVQEALSNFDKFSEYL